MADQKPAKPNQPGNQPADLKELGEGLRRARGDRGPESAGPGRVDRREMTMAFRVAIELAAAIFVGGLLGWFLDQWLGTRPWFFLVFLILGMASGTMSAFRTAKKFGGPGQE